VSDAVPMLRAGDERFQNEDAERSLEQLRGFGAHDAFPWQAYARNSHDACGFARASPDELEEVSATWSQDRHRDKPLDPAVTRDCERAA
jgi:hypothetical protein